MESEKWNRKKKNYKTKGKLVDLNPGMSVITLIIIKNCQTTFKKKL
jgi:hypothetical protein